jgi:hypothetical protein
MINSGRQWVVPSLSAALVAATLEDLTATDTVQMSGRDLVCAIAPRPTKSGIARPHQNLGGGPGNFARIAPKKRPIAVKFYRLVEFIEAHILVI